jgi:hypothetical protein
VKCFKGPYLTKVANFTERATNLVKRRLNRRMLMMPRAQDFNLPTGGNPGEHVVGTYFSDGPRVQAKEHQNMSQAMPHILAGLVPKDLLDLAIM